MYHLIIFLHYLYFNIVNYNDIPMVFLSFIYHEKDAACDAHWDLPMRIWISILAWHEMCRIGVLDNLLSEHHKNGYKHT